MKWLMTSLAMAVIVSVVFGPVHLRSYTIGDPIIDESLAIFPITSTTRTPRTDYLTLTEAQAEGLVTISEVGEGTVPDV
ncbi:MAG: hypothetical protein NZ959_01470, partial [Armatimonadetes bacterium]|nr:hypothetical protein [Armatimonadota bacterium]MDW8121329.1 DUF6569 family protein [Armatimonadota bacterium]